MRSTLFNAVVIVCAFVGIVLLQAQRAKTALPAIESTTQQRLESESWWPTMSAAPLEAYTGTPGCVRCHSEETADGPGSAMSRAAAHAGDEGVPSLAKGESLDLNGFVYTLLPLQPGLEYKVSRSNTAASQRLDWVMGAGDLGRTFVYQDDGRWFQSRISEYRQAPHLDVTTGLTIPLASDADSELTAELGKALSPEEVRHCFSCHTVHATSSRGFNPAHAEAGLGCEACHGPGAGHVKTMDSNANAKQVLRIFNPASLAAADSIDFCGACHRTFGDVTQAANPANDSSVVRFQPYRLEKSRCWRETQDVRLTCVACHDPHGPLVRDDVSYDKHCLGCHLNGNATDHAAKACPTGAKTQCVSCHMPKVKVASMHGVFTDHFIQVVKSGNGFVQ